jgi:hypothetical protein
MQGFSKDSGPLNSPGRSKEVAILVVGSPHLSAREIELSSAESTRVKKRLRQQEEVKAAKEQGLVTALNTPPSASITSSKKPKSNTSGGGNVGGGQVGAMEVDDDDDWLQMDEKVQRVEMECRKDSWIFRCPRCAPLLQVRFTL